MNNGHVTVMRWSCDLPDGSCMTLLKYSEGRIPCLLPGHKMTSLADWKNWYPSVEKVEVCVCVCASLLSKPTIHGLVKVNKYQYL